MALHVQLYKYVTFFYVLCIYVAHTNLSMCITLLSIAARWCIPRLSNTQGGLPESSERVPEGDCNNNGSKAMVLKPAGFTN